MIFGTNESISCVSNRLYKRRFGARSVRSLAACSRTTAATKRSRMDHLSVSHMLWHVHSTLTSSSETEQDWLVAKQRLESGGAILSHKCHHSKLCLRRNIETKRALGVLHCTLCAHAVHIVALSYIIDLNFGFEGTDINLRWTKRLR